MDKQNDDDITINDDGVIYLINKSLADVKTYIIDYYDIVWSKRGFRVYDTY